MQGKIVEAQDQSATFESLNKGTFFVRGSERVGNDTIPRLKVSNTDWFDFDPKRGVGIYNWNPGPVLAVKPIGLSWEVVR